VSPYSSFFGGAIGNGPAVQQKLAFVSRAKDESTKENIDDDNMSDVEGGAKSSHSADSDSDISTKRKRGRASRFVIDIDEDDEPISKKPKKSVHKNMKARDGSVKPEKEEDSSPQSSPDTTAPSQDENLVNGHTNGTKVKKEEELSSQPVASESAAESESSEDEEDNLEKDEEDIKPEVAAKERAKVQSKLKSEKHPYPDWKAGEPAPYAALCTTFSLIEMTTKRLEIMAHCSLFLKQVFRLTPEDLLPTILLMVNKLASDYAGIELGIGESLVMKAIGEATGRALSVIKEDHHKIGDLGLVATKSRLNQRTMFAPKPLTIRGVHQQLLAIATMSGSGAQGNKVKGMNKLLGAADAHVPKGTKIDITEQKGGPSEAKFLVRAFEGKLRLGLAERTVLVSLAHAATAFEVEKSGKNANTEQISNGESILKSVYSELPSYELVIPALLEHGIFKLEDYCQLRAGVPLKPMLAKPTKSITEVLDRFEGNTFTCEYKYDGERAQIHYVSKKSTYQPIVPGSVPPRSAEGLSAIFSRNSENLSKKYPDVLAKIESWLKPETESFVLDCETVGWDIAEKKILPFQQLMTRKRKDVKIEDVKVKVCIFAFDLLFLNGEVRASFLQANVKIN
jgi:DNA ligase-1